MKFYLRVHSIIGGAPGEPGSPGGAVPGGDLGFGGGSSGTGFGFGPLTGFEGGFFTGGLIGALPGALIAGLIGLAATQARGDPDPAFGTGVSGPDSGVGVGGGPGFTTSTLVQKALTAPVVAPVTAPVVPAKAPIIPPPTPQKKRVGRQETILTSGLAETETFKPTLLGQ